VHDADGAALKGCPSRIPVFEIVDEELAVSAWQTT
jgi:hypothetical protein